MTTHGVPFPLPSLLVVERGSLPSPSVVVARDLGIPAVIGLPGATRWLQDGDQIESDGSTGALRRVAA